MSPEVDGVAFRLCIHLVKNPGAAMFTGDVADKWGVDVKAVHTRLAHAVKGGYITKNKIGARVYYSAGPKL